jgi:hypothetical protein
MGGRCVRKDATSTPAAVHSRAGDPRSGSGEARLAAPIYCAGSAVHQCSSTPLGNCRWAWVPLLIRCPAAGRGEVGQASPGPSAAEGKPDSLGPSDALTRGGGGKKVAARGTARWSSVSRRALVSQTRTLVASWGVAWARASVVGQLVVQALHLQGGERAQGEGAEVGRTWSSVSWR